MIGVVVATIIIVFAFTIINNNSNAKIDPSSISIVSEDAFISLTITGQVIRPGTYVAKIDETIGDLIMAAGGVTNNADARAYIEETVIQKGVNYYIAPINDLDDYCGDKALAKANINVDNRDKLMEVNGIGGSIASDIIAYRAEHGPFTYLEELLKVKGIGNATFDKIKNFVTLR